MSNSDAYGPPLSSRPIQHIIPKDGTEHVMVECYCHPSIVESNGAAAVMGLEDAGVRESASGELIFQHNSAGDTSAYLLVYEVDEEEGGE